MTGTHNKNPTIFVILGATGDLTERKIIPALFSLFGKNLLPKPTQIIGFSRREWDEEKFRGFVSEVLDKKGLSSEGKDNFINSVSYHKGDFLSVSDFQNFSERLSGIDADWGVCSNKLFYLAAPPKYYKDIFNNLSESNLTKACSPEEGWTRIIVEKPFGKDLKTAQELDNLLGNLFEEKQIFRIDHYLGKEMLQNILAFRFSNNLFDSSWNNKFIDSIEVKLLETGDVEGRGRFYDGIGALRDVGQNHLLQMLALTTMENPGDFTPESIRRKREKLISMIRVPSDIRIQKETFRAQFVGYQDVEDVSDASNTETYFKTSAYIDSSRWRGVQITLESGKAMQEQKKEVVVRFKHPSPCMCPPGSDHESHNKVIFAIEPKEEITFRMIYKKPGYELDLEKRSFDLPYREIEERVQYTEEYERLLLDCFSGDQTLFVTSNEMQAMWKFTDPVVRSWQENKVQLHTYSPGEEDIRVQATEYVLKGMTAISPIKREVGIVGIGKMGTGLSKNLISKGWKVVGYNRSIEKTKELEDRGLIVSATLEEFISNLSEPRVVWLMVPAGKPVEDVTSKLAELMHKGDILIDGGNSYYEDTIKRAKKVQKSGKEFIDVGVSGGPKGARDGASLMIGGSETNYEKLLPLFIDLSVPGGHAHFEGIGAGHFVKMVHNAIEYGMMQSIAEGFDLMSNSDYKLKLEEVARVYNNGSVIESRLIDWMRDAFGLFGDDLKEVSGSAGSGGAAGMEKSEAKWTADLAKKLGIRTDVISGAINARLNSQEDPNFQGKVINALRNRFGGHSVK